MKLTGYPIVVLKKIAVNDGLLAGGRIILDSRQEVGNNISKKLKSKACSTHSSKRIRKNGIGDSAVRNVKLEPGIHPFEAKAFSDSRNLTVVTDLVVKIKKEKDSKSEAAYKLFGSSAHFNDTFLPVLKTKDNCEENENSVVLNDSVKNHFDGHSSFQSVSLAEKSLRKLCRKRGPQSKTNFDSNSVKLTDASAKLYDNVLSNTKRLGKARSSNKSCESIYRRGIYKSSCDSKKLESKRGSMPAPSCQKFRKNSDSGIRRKVEKIKKLYKCEECERKYVSKAGLVYHMRGHTNERPYGCKLCSKRFKQSTSLNTHVRCIHTDERPFKCEHCSMTFNRQEQFRYHLKVHNGERSECDLCSVVFTWPNHLKRHMSSVHSTDRPFSCNNCSATFKRRDKLQYHSRNIHGIDLRGVLSSR